MRAYLQSERRKPRSDPDAARARRPRRWTPNNPAHEPPRPAATETLRADMNRAHRPASRPPGQRHRRRYPPGRLARRRHRDPWTASSCRSTWTRARSSLEETTRGSPCELSRGGLRSGRRQRERQRLRVRARTQRVVQRSPAARTSICTASLDTGAAQVSSVVGAAETPSARPLPPCGPCLQRLRQRERAVDQVPGGRPSTGRPRSAPRHRRWRSRWRSAAPCRPCGDARRNAPNAAGVPSVSASVAGTLPPTVPSVPVAEHDAVAVLVGSLSDVAGQRDGAAALEVDRDRRGLAGLGPGQRVGQVHLPPLAPVADRR